MPRVQLPSRADTAFSRLAAPESLKTALLLHPEYVAYFDDFIGVHNGTWPANAQWMYAATVGTGTEAISIGDVAGGTLIATTSSASGDGAYQYLGLNWKVANGIYGIWKVKFSSATSGKLEVGFTDSVTAEGIINSKGSDTFTATDGACFIFDSADDTKLSFMTVNNGAAGCDIDTITMDTAYHILEIKIGPGGFASGYVDGVPYGGGALTSTALLGPQVLGVTTRAASTVTGTLDYCGVVGSRD